MPSGRLGKAALAANTDTTLYTVPADTVATATVCVCNRGPDTALVRLSVASSAAPTAPTTAEFLEYDVALPIGAVLERTGLVCTAAERIVVRSNTANVTARVHGFEEAA